MEWDWNRPTNKLGKEIKTGFYYHHASRSVIYIERFPTSVCIGEGYNSKNESLSSLVLQDCVPIRFPCVRAKRMRQDADFIDRKLIELGLQSRIDERDKKQ